MTPRRSLRVPTASGLTMRCAVACHEGSDLIKWPPPSFPIISKWPQSQTPSTNGMEIDVVNELSLESNAVSNVHGVGPEMTNFSDSKMSIMVRTVTAKRRSSPSDSGATAKMPRAQSERAKDRERTVPKLCRTLRRHVERDLCWSLKCF